MSINAMNWAMNQRTGSPSAQCVLYVIADMATTEGTAFPSINYLADRTEQSADTVRRRLRDLEENGLLVRFERHDETGRRTSDEIRLQMGACAVQMADFDKENEESSAGGDPSKLQGGTLANCERPLAPVQGGPSQWCKGINQESNQDSNPQTPFQGALASDDVEIEKRVEAFKAVYPCPTTKPDELARLIAALTPDESGQMIKAASGYAVHCERQKRKAMDPVRFARDPSLWPDFEKLAPKPKPGKVFIERGSREWASLCVYRAIAYGSGEYLPPLASPGHPCSNGRDGTFIDERIDLKAMDSLADLASETGRPDFDAWMVCEHETRQWWAWQQRIKRFGFGELNADLIDVPGEFDTINSLEGKTFTAPKRITGRLVPTEWPPRMTGDDAVSASEPAETAEQEHMA